MKNSVNNDYPVLKGRLLATLVLLLCVMMIGTAVAQSFGVVSRTETLNLRSQGSSSSQWLGSYSRGTWVEITGSQNNFYYVRTPDGKTGYMSKNYIDVSGESGTARIALVTNQNGGSFLNFRAQPGMTRRCWAFSITGCPCMCLTSKTAGIAWRSTDRRVMCAASL